MPIDRDPAQWISNRPEYSSANPQPMANRPVTRQFNLVGLHQHVDETAQPGADECCGENDDYIKTELAGLLYRFEVGPTVSGGYATNNIEPPRYASLCKLDNQ